MKSLSGPSHSDQITKDIRDAVREGYFDSPDRLDNELMNTPVKQLLKDVAMMSPRKRKAYLAKLGGIRTEVSSLTGKLATKSSSNKWLSR
tara:strand:+ start:435 stop:704 length:270 start_codon:yes stop_codon:yes gene_type:complete